MASGTLVDVLAQVMHHQYQAIDCATHLVQVADKARHVGRTVFITTGHAAGQRIHHQHTGRAHSLFGLLPGTEHGLHIALTVEQVDRKRNHFQRHLGAASGLLHISQHALRNAKLSFCGQINHATGLDPVAKPGPTAGDCHRQIKTEKGLSRAALANHCGESAHRQNRLDPVAIAR